MYIANVSRNIAGSLSLTNRPLKYQSEMQELSTVPNLLLQIQERKSKSKVWGTSVSREFADEIDEFLIKHNVTKVAVITAGFEALKAQYEK